jgi:pyrimidine-nucleoside phosphorylase/thymidine phosphorylase
MRALITRMDQPLGNAVGNAVEVAESIECLKGGGPEDLVSLSIELAAEMVMMAGLAGTLDVARELCRRTIADGTALERFRKLIEAQGGDPGVLDDSGRLPSLPGGLNVPSPRSGYVRSLSARKVGHASTLLGAGRARVDSKIDPAVGVILHKKLGDPVEAWEPLCTLLVGEASDHPSALVCLSEAYSIGDEPVTPPELIVERI